MNLAAINEKRLALARSLLSADIALAISDPKGDLPELLPEEVACLSPHAIPRRYKEFAAGRAAARDAMEQLGFESEPILVGHDRAPIWPAGMVGSITHTHSCAVAAVAKESEVYAIGIDVEESTPLEDRLIDIICSARERDWLRTQDSPALMAKLVFSAKEAAYKCQYPLSGRLFGFEGLELEVDPDAGIFHAVFTEDQMPFEKGATIKGRFVIGASLILTAAELRGAASS